MNTPGIHSGPEKEDLTGFLFFCIALLLFFVVSERAFSMEAENKVEKTPETLLPGERYMNAISGEWTLPCEVPKLSDSINLNFGVIQNIKFEKTGEFESRYLIFKDSKCKELLRITYSKGSFDYLSLNPSDPLNPHHYLEILQETQFSIAKSDSLQLIESRYHPMKYCPNSLRTDTSLFNDSPNCYAIDLAAELTHSNFIGLEINPEKSELFLRQSFFANAPNTGLNQPTCFMNPIKTFSDFLSFSEAVDRSVTSNTYCYRFLRVKK